MITTIGAIPIAIGTVHRRLGIVRRAPVRRNMVTRAILAIVRPTTGPATARRRISTAQATVHRVHALTFDLPLWIVRVNPTTAPMIVLVNRGSVPTTARGSLAIGRTWALAPTRAAVLLSSTKGHVLVGPTTRLDRLSKSGKAYQASALRRLLFFDWLQK